MSECNDSKKAINDIRRERRRCGDYRTPIFYKVERNYQDEFLSPKVPTWIIAIIFIIIGSFCFGTIVSRNIFANEVLNMKLDNNTTAILIAAGVISILIAGILLRIGFIKNGIKNHMQRREDKKARRRAADAGIDDLSFLRLLDKHTSLVFGKGYRESSRSLEYFVTNNISFIFDVLSYHKCKNNLPEKYREYSASREEYALHEKELSNFLGEFESVARIWNYMLKQHGISLEYNEETDLNNHERVNSWHQFGREIGVESAIDLYYDGVPIEDILS